MAKIIDSTFRKDFAWLLNIYSKENGSDTPDFLLAAFLTSCLSAFDSAVRQRDVWHKGGVPLKYRIGEASNENNK